MRALARTTRNFGFLLASGLAAFPALAGTPKALDYVPADAQTVIVVPNLGKMLSDMNALNAMLGAQSQPGILMMTSMVRGMPGINLDGSVAAVMKISMEDDAQDPDVVILLPVSDFEAFSMGQTPNSNGLVQLPLGDEPVFARSAGNGYAVMGPDADLVKAFDAGAGNLKAHTDQLGKAGGRIAESNDIFVYMNLDAFRAEIAQGMQQLEAQGDMVEMMSGPEAARGFDSMIETLHTVSNDGSALIMGTGFTPGAGLAFDMGVQFKDDSSTAAYLQNKGEAGKYFAHVPQMDYFYASAFDFSGDGIQKIMTQYVQTMEKTDTTGMLKAMNLSKLMSDLDGGVQIVGASDNIMGGLLANSMYYMDVENPKEYIASLQQLYKGMGQNMAQLQQAGVKIDATMDEQPTSIDGVDAYGYSMAMDMSQMNQMAGGGMGGMNPGMVMNMVFGASGGPSGYIAQAGDGVVLTLSRDAKLFSRAAKAADGKNTMSADASIAQTAKLLPDNRVVESYVGIDHLINTAGPMLMMFGLIPEFEPVGALPPLGMGVTADGGGVMMRTIVPSTTISSMLGMIPQGAMHRNMDQDTQHDDMDRDDEDDDDMSF